MAISKVIYKESANATPVTWMDATPATATAADIVAPLTAMLADGVLTTGTGSGGGGGLEFESGTWTPAEDIIQPTITFSKTHTETPVFAAIADSNGTYYDTSNSTYTFSYIDWYKLTGSGIYRSSSSVGYVLLEWGYRATSATSLNDANAVVLTNYGSTSNLPTWPRYYVTESEFKPYARSNSYYFRSGRTYKWIAVWMPTA